MYRLRQEEKAYKYVIYHTLKVDSTDKVPHDKEVWGYRGTPLKRWPQSSPWYWVSSYEDPI